VKLVGNKYILHKANTFPVAATIFDCTVYKGYPIHLHNQWDGRTEGRFQ